MPKMSKAQLALFVDATMFLNKNNKRANIQL